MPGSKRRNRKLDPSDGVMLNVSDVSVLNNNNDLFMLLGLGMARVDTTDRTITMQPDVPVGDKDVPRIHWGVPRASCRSDTDNDSGSAVY